MSRRMEKCHSQAKLTLIQIKADNCDYGRNRNEREFSGIFACACAGQDNMLHDTRGLMP